MSTNVETMGPELELIKKLSDSLLLWILRRFATKKFLRECVAQLYTTGRVGLKDLEDFSKMSGPPKTDSSNSSKPPSTDWKSSKSASQSGSSKTGRNRGGQPKHPPHNRKLASEPDDFKRHWPDKCGNCAKPFGIEGDNPDSDSNSNILTHEVVGEYDHIELVEKPIITTRHERMEVTCACCGKATAAEAPPEASDSPFGFRLQSFLMMLKNSHHFSYDRLSILSAELGCRISPGALVNMTRRLVKLVEPHYEAIRDMVRSSSVIQSDETGLRVDGKNHFHWVFLCHNAICHLVRNSRSREVIIEFLNGVNPLIWISDRFSAHQGIGQRQQTCLAHLYRKALAVLQHGDMEIGNDLCVWTEKTFRFAKDMPNMTGSAIKKKAQELRLEMTEIVNRETDCKITQPGLTAFRNAHYDDQLLTFADFPPGEVPVTNNNSERALRHSVIMRKVIYCFRSDWGAEAYAKIRSVIETSALKGKSSFQTMLELYKQVK